MTARRVNIIRRCSFCGTHFNDNKSGIMVVSGTLPGTDSHPGVCACGSCIQKMVAIAEEVSPGFLEQLDSSRG